MNSPLYLLSSQRPLRRREFLGATSSLAAAALWSSRALGQVSTQPKFSADPFSLGVASGDPTSTGVVLWTRLAPDPLNGGGMPAEDVEVRWQVAEDEGMRKIVTEGKTVANPDWAHSVHVEVEGLRPDRWYWYRFQAGSAESPIGRTRTMPGEDVLADRLRFAFASCQHYETGLYTAYEHMVREELDLVFHLGDYIYEGPGRDGFVRRHNSDKLITLPDYRNRYALYKVDPALKAMHAAAPWVVTWDDHEVENNYADGVSELDTDPAAFLQQRAAAYKAYYEHMPLRRASLPKGPDMALYRKINFGRLASFAVLDTRQYRSPIACGGKRSPQCPEALSPDRSVLGSEQREWLFRTLGKSPATWNVLAQQIMMARVDRAAGPKEAFSMDQWPGYEADRRRVLEFFRDRKVANPVVLTGDIHSHWANEIPADPDRPDAPAVATEFVGTSISSSGDGTAKPKDYDQVMAENPGTKFFSVQRGYVQCEVTPKGWTSNYRVLEYVSRPGAPISTPAKFTVQAGRPKLEQA